MLGYNFPLVLMRLLITFLDNAGDENGGEMGVYSYAKDSDGDC